MRSSLFGISCPYVGSTSEASPWPRREPFRHDGRWLDGITMGLLEGEPR